MQTLVQIPALLPMLDTAHAVIVPSRPAMEILSHVLLVADERGLTVSATDLDQTMQAVLPATVRQAGSAMVPLSRLRDALKGLKGGAELRLTGDKLEVEAAGLTLSLPVLSNDAQRPVFYLKETAESIRISDGSGFADDLALVAPFMSKEETRYYLGGVFLRIRDGEMRLVGTNGTQLGEVTRPYAAGVVSECIMPAAFVEAVLRLGKAGPVAVEVGHGASGTRLSVSRGGTTIQSKVIDGTYPDYGRMFNDEWPVGFTLDAAAAGAGARNIATAIAANPHHRLTVRVADEFARLSGGNHQIESATNIAAARDGTIDRDIVYPLRAFIEMMGIMDGEVRIRLPASSPNRTGHPTMLLCPRLPHLRALLVEDRR